MDTVDCARFLTVLADPTRLRILEVLQGRELGVGEVSRTLGVAHYQASRHLSALHDAGLVVRRKERRRVFYRMADQVEGGRIELGCCAVELPRST